MEEVMSGIWVQVASAVVGVLGIALIYGLRKFATWIVAKAELNANEQEAMQTLLEGMSLAQEELVREAKTAAIDGKLTKDEISKAQALALSHAKAVATGPVKDIILSWSERRAASLIKQLLAKYKGTSNGTVAVAPVANPEATV